MGRSSRCGQHMMDRPSNSERVCSWRPAPAGKGNFGTLCTFTLALQQQPIATSQPPSLDGACVVLLAAGHNKRRRGDAVVIQRGGCLAHRPPNHKCAHQRTKNIDQRLHTQKLDGEVGVKYAAAGANGSSNVQQHRAPTWPAPSSPPRPAYLCSASGTCVTLQRTKTST